MKTMMWAAAAAIILGACTLGAWEGSALAAPTRITWTDSATTRAGSSRGRSRPLRSSARPGRSPISAGSSGSRRCRYSDGTFTFKTQTPDTWAFAPGGTGRYSTLRGRGTCQVTQTEQESQGRAEALADFDAVPPSARIERAKLIVPDARTSCVSRSVPRTTSWRTRSRSSCPAVAAGRRLASRAGAVGAGTTEFVLKVRPPHGHARSWSRSRSSTRSATRRPSDAR